MVGGFRGENVEVPMLISILEARIARLLMHWNETYFPSKRTKGPCYWTLDAR
jgi:hypothetical protein